MTAPDVKAIAAAVRAQMDLLDPPVTPSAPDSRFEVAITATFDTGKLSSNFSPAYDKVAGTAAVGKRNGSLGYFRNGDVVLACERPSASSTDYNKWSSTGVAMARAHSSTGAGR